MLIVPTLMAVLCIFGTAHGLANGYTSVRPLVAALFFSTYLGLTMIVAFVRGAWVRGGLLSLPHVALLLRVLVTLLSVWVVWAYWPS